MTILGFRDIQIYVYTYTYMDQGDRGMIDVHPSGFHGKSSGVTLLRPVGESKKVDPPRWFREVTQK